MQILVLIGSSVSEVGQVKVCHFPFKRYMAYNNLHSTTVHAVMLIKVKHVSVCSSEYRKQVDDETCADG
jgi:hypothetical protein